MGIEIFLLEIDFLFTFICSTQLCELSIILWFLYNFNNLFQGEVIRGINFAWVGQD